MHSLPYTSFGCLQVIDGGFFRCGSLEHLIAQCPRESRDSRSQQGGGRGRSAAPLLTRNRGRGRSGPSQHRGRGGIVSETVDRLMLTARAYAMKAREDKDAPEVITCIFSLYDIEMHALIDPGSTHSYVCMDHVFNKVPAMEKLAYDMHVTSPLGHSVYRNYPIVIQAREFLADLITLPFREFDLILGIDWLTKHRAIIDYGQKTVVL